MNTNDIDMMAKIKKDSNAKRVSDMDISEIEVLPEYSYVIKAVKEKYPAIFVTGKAGTGKSTFIRYTLENILKSVVVAPTAIAAINVEGVTIHSFFSVPPRILNDGETVSPKPVNIAILKQLDVLIIDEISMVGPDIIDCLDNTLKKLLDKTKPFGGLTIIFVGDLFQLPPVVSGKAMKEYYSLNYKNQYFYSAKVFNQLPIKNVELTKVFRQTDSEFISALDKIRINKDHRDAVALFNTKCYLEKQEYRMNSQEDLAETLTLVTINATAKAINDTKLNSLTTKESVFKATYQGELLDSSMQFPVPDILRVKVGAKVIFRQNKMPEWVNGSMGTVTKIDGKLIWVKIANTTREVQVDISSWDKIAYKYNRDSKKIESKVVGKFIQYPISLGWAVTIHKSQGMTLDAINIDLGRGAFCSGQVYVALSRCKTIENITLLTPISMADVKTDIDIVEFYEQLTINSDLI